MSLSIISLLLKGLTAGTVSGLPLGPMGVRCLHDTLRHGRKTGLASATGIALALGMWGGVLNLSLRSIAPFLLAHQSRIQFALGIVVILIGVRSLSRTSAGNAGGEVETRKTSRTRAFASTFLVVATNPLTLLTLTAVFAALGLVEGDEPAHALGVACSVTIGAMLAWVMITQLTHSIGARAGSEVTALLCSLLSWMLVLLGIAQTFLGALRLFGPL